MSSTPPSLVAVCDTRDVPAAYRDTAVADLLAYHNLGAPPRTYARAELLIGMCMDHRKRLRIPEKFAYIMRAAGANFEGLTFPLSFAIAVGGVRAIAVIGHDQCGMSGLAACRESFVSGLVDSAGWARDSAERHFDEQAPRFEINDPIVFTFRQAAEIRERYPQITVAPLLYRLDDGMLYVISDPEEHGGR